jgi:hypothetical protein
LLELVNVDILLDMSLGKASTTIYNHPAFVPKVVPSAPVIPTHSGQLLPTLGELLSKPLDEMVRYNTGFVNLLCATTLPDTFDLNIPQCVKTLHDWTERVRSETARCFHQYRRSPGQYNHSEAYFRVLMMVTVFQQDFGVTYAPDSRERMMFDSSREGFLHGLLSGDRTGTCANMPVLYITIGRKLGYPLYLVSAKSHLFCRWHDGKTGERFNIEASGRGLTTPEDDYYMSWPREISDAEVYHGIYLRDLEPVEEIGNFMATRGHCLLDKGHLLDAIVAYSHAHRLAPCDPSIMGFLLAALNREIELHRAGKLPASYRQAEQWCDENAFELARFVIDSRYDERVAKSNINPSANGQTLNRE